MALCCCQLVDHLTVHQLQRFELSWGFNKKITANGEKESRTIVGFFYFPENQTKSMEQSFQGLKISSQLLPNSSKNKKPKWLGSVLFET